MQSSTGPALGDDSTIVLSPATSLSDSQSETETEAMTMPQAPSPILSVTQVGETSTSDANEPSARIAQLEMPEDDLIALVVKHDGWPVEQGENPAYSQSQDNTQRMIRQRLQNHFARVCYAPTKIKPPQPESDHKQYTRARVKSILDYISRSKPVLPRTKLLFLRWECECRRALGADVITESQQRRLQAVDECMTKAMWPLTTPRDVYFTFTLLLMRSVYIVEMIRDEYFVCEGMGLGDQMRIRIRPNPRVLRGELQWLRFAQKIKSQKQLWDQPYLNKTLEDNSAALDAENCCKDYLRVHDACRTAQLNLTDTMSMIRRFAKDKCKIYNRLDRHLRRRDFSRIAVILASVLEDMQSVFPLVEAKLVARTGRYFVGLRDHWFTFESGNISNPRTWAPTEALEGQAKLLEDGQEE